ncbi:MAG: DUF805 domain-containing protein [Gammaproteobacteria bacterium]
MLNINLKISDFYSFKGRLSRLDFLLGILAVSLVVLSLHYSLMPLVRRSGELNTLLIFLVSLQFLSSLSATPFYVKRLHDLNSSGAWAFAFWVIFPFSFEVSGLVQRQTGLLINPLNEVAVWGEVLTFLGFLVLLFKKGNPEKNKWGSPNQTLSSDALTRAS